MLSSALASFAVVSADRTVEATSVGDPGATRTVYGVVIALAVLGVALVVIMVWLMRATRPDPELLAPLEVMDTRRWRRLDPAGQRRLLDDVRPEAAVPLHREKHAPSVDEEFEEIPPVADFDDLTAVAHGGGDADDSGGPVAAGERQRDGVDLALVFDDSGGRRRDAAEGVPVGDDLDLRFDESGDPIRDPDQRALAPESDPTSGEGLLRRPAPDVG